MLEGDGLTIFPGKTEDEATKMEVPIKPGMALPVHTGHHIVRNTGTVDCEMVFFELKPKKPPVALSLAFGGGDHPGSHLDCCTSNPDNYKVIAQTDGGRLVEMTLPPGK